MNNSEILSIKIIFILKNKREKNSINMVCIKKVSHVVPETSIQFEINTIANL